MHGNSSSGRTLCRIPRSRRPDYGHYSHRPPAHGKDFVYKSGQTQSSRVPDAWAAYKQLAEKMNSDDRLRQSHG